ncbi:GAF and ANTAR domain-containing protein [Microlunatus lacustris]
MPRPSPDRDLDGVFAQAARDLQDEGDTPHMLDRGLAIASQLIPSSAYVGISVVQADGRIDTPALTDPLVARIDDLQYRVQQGPCLDAIASSEIISSPDLRQEARWPRWSSKVAELGVVSMLCLRLYTSRDTLGALNLLATHPEAFDDEAVITASHLAAHLAVALAETQHAAELHSGALDRSILGQAEGILMERFSLTPRRAFEVLSQVAQHHNASLGRVAAELVRTRVTPGGHSTEAALNEQEPWLP